MAHFPQKSIQPTGNVTLPSDGIYVALEARPNTDFPAEDWRSRLSRPLEWKRVMNLSEAVNAVDQFIRTYHLGGGNYAGMAGRVAKDGQPWAQISYNRRIWQGWDPCPVKELDRNGNPIASVEVGTKGNVAVPDAVRSYKAEMKVHGGWSANQRRWRNAGRGRRRRKGLVFPMDRSGGLPSCPEQRSTQRRAGDQRETCGEDGAE